MTEQQEKQQQQQQEERVALTLDLLHAAHPHAAQPSLERYFQCFTKTASFLGTASGDRWSMPQYQRYMVPLYAPSEQRVIPVKPVESSRKISFHGNGFASFDEVLLGRDAQGEVVSELRGSGSMVFDQEQDAWKIALYHLSVPIPNGAALAVSKQLQAEAPPSAQKKMEDENEVTSSSEKLEENPSNQKEGETEPTQKGSSSGKKKKKKSKK